MSKSSVSIMVHQEVVDFLHSIILERGYDISINAFIRLLITHGHSCYDEWQYDAKLSIRILDSSYWVNGKDDGRCRLRIYTSHRGMLRMDKQYAYECLLCAMWDLDLGLDDLALGSYVERV